MDPPAPLEVADEAEADGRPGLVAVGRRRRAVIVVADTVKETSAPAIAELRARPAPVLLTGDNRRAADAVAAQVGIDEVIAEVLPADKVDVVKRLQAEGGSWRWSATASTTRPRWPRPTSAWRWAPVRTWRSRPPT